MNTEQIVRASADVVTITHLSPGDVYKRVETAGYSSGPALRYGVVLDVMNNGTDAAVSAVEYRTDYSSGVVGEPRVITSGSDLAIYPATPEEVAAHAAEMLEAARRAVTESEKALTVKRENLARAEQIMARVTDGTLSAPATTGAAALEAGQ